MKEKVSAWGYAIHPTLAAFPIAFYLAATIGYSTYAMNSNILAFQIAYCATLAGLVSSIAAAIPGFVDLKNTTTVYSETRILGRSHALYHFAAFLCFGTIAILLANEWFSIQPVANGSVFLSVVGLACTIRAGFIGWQIVQAHQTTLLESENIVFDTKDYDLQKDRARKQNVSNL